MIYKNYYYYILNIFTLVVQARVEVQNIHSALFSPHVNAELEDLIAGLLSTNFHTNVET